MTTTVAFPDERTRQLFLDNQTKLQTLQRQLGKVSVQQNASERESKVIALTLKELASFPESTQTYQSVGRMFLSVHFDKVKSEFYLLLRSLLTRTEILDEKRVSFENESKAFKRASEKLESEIKDAQEIVKDLINGAKTE